jgi:hypothetical protein
MLLSESIDSYYNRFHELLEDLSDADEPIALKSEIHQFVFTLGPEFETIQNNFCIGNLPSAWNTLDWPTLLCRDYYNSVKPGSFNCRFFSKYY